MLLNKCSIDNEDRNILISYIINHYNITLRHFGDGTE